MVGVSTILGAFCDVNPLYSGLGFRVLLPRGPKIGPTNCENPRSYKRLQCNSTERFQCERVKKEAEHLESGGFPNLGAPLGVRFTTTVVFWGPLF